MINSDISTTISHTKVPTTPNQLKILPLVGSSLVNKFWGGVEVPVIFQVYSDNTPIHFSWTTEPTILSSDFEGVEVNNVTLLTARGWGESDAACSDLALACYSADILIPLSGYDTLSSIDECNNLTETEIPKTITGSITFGLDILDAPEGMVINSLSGSIVNASVTTLDDPLVTLLLNEDTSYLDYLNQYDIKDFNGNGVLFCNPESKASEILNSIFGDEFTNKINQKVLNFGDNVTNVDKADTNALDNLGEILGVESSGFSVGIPTELQDILKLGSIKYEDLFGVGDLSTQFDENNIGQIINPSDYVSAGELVFVQEINSIDVGYQIFTIQSQNGLSSLNTNLGESYYQLSAIDHPIYTTDKYCFWRNETIENIPTINNILGLGGIENIPNKQEWDELIEQKICYHLVRNLIT